jgi:hypothetical protein
MSNTTTSTFTFPPTIDPNLQVIEQRKHDCYELLAATPTKYEPGKCEQRIG